MTEYTEHLIKAPRRDATDKFRYVWLVIVPLIAILSQVYIPRLERAQPYLWRFWRHLTRKGRVTIYDRTWYGRVHVELIERFCAEADWMRAYSEINDFESQLAAANTVLCKYWLQISKDEQLRRFKDRAHTEFKHFKITDEDWRNRKKWELYQSAAADMVEHTSTDVAPWTLIEANDKRFARVKVLKTLCRRIERALDGL